MNKAHAAIVQCKLSDNQHPCRGYHGVHYASRVTYERSSFQQSLMQKFMPVIFYRSESPHTSCLHHQLQYHISMECWRLFSKVAGGGRGQARSMTSHTAICQPRYPHRHHLSICKEMVTILQVPHVHQPTSPARSASQVDTT